MSSNFEKSLIEEFSQLDYNKFKVDWSDHKIFVCGGRVDVTAIIPPSFRDRFMSYTAENEVDLHKGLVLAENFKDYFKDNNYSNLVVFEEEIANISTLVIIFLESPGSFVELGMFCNIQSYYRKLLVIAPKEQIENEDSFIFLGPLEFMKKIDQSSVAIYPWPSPDEEYYNIDHIEDLCSEIQSKISKFPKSETFRRDNSGHVALLICEIVTLSYPILISEIITALNALGVEVAETEVMRSLYLLGKLEYIAHEIYSTTYKYYYPLNKNQKKVKLGKGKAGKVIDSSTIKLSIRESFIGKDDGLSKKRKNALKLIEDRLKGVQG